MFEILAMSYSFKQAKWCHRRGDDCNKHCVKQPIAQNHHAAADASTGCQRNFCFINHAHKARFAECAFLTRLEVSKPSEQLAAANQQRWQSSSQLHGHLHAKVKPALGVSGTAVQLDPNSDAAAF